MYKPTAINRTHAEDLLAALNKVHELQQTLRERTHLHPMNLPSNVRNIQAMLPPEVCIVIGKADVYIADTALEYGIRCTPEDMPAAMDMQRYLSEMKAKEEAHETQPA